MSDRQVHDRGARRGARRAADDRRWCSTTPAPTSDYGEFHGHARTTATTYTNDNVFVCVLEDILSARESSQIAAGQSSDVIDARVAFSRAPRTSSPQRSNA